MGKLIVERCPETGICSIVKDDETKIDLISDEVESLRRAAGHPESLRKVLAEVDADFAAQLGTEELDQLATDLS